MRELRRVSAAGNLAQPNPFEAAAASTSKPEPAAGGAGGLFGKRKASAAALPPTDIEMGAVGGKQQFMESFFQDVEGVKVRG